MKRRHQDSSHEQVLLDHVRELQKRLLVVVVVLAAAGSLGYVFYTQIFTILRSPLGADLYYNSPAGSFGFVMKICTMVGIAVALPVIIYNLIMFLRPAFEKVLTLKSVYKLTAGSVLLAVSGAAFGYFLIIPGALHFFSGFQMNGLAALITADSYLSFVTNVIITFVLVFQIPLLMVLIDRIKPISPKKLFSMEKYVVIAGLTVSILVPFAFDFITCLLIAAPIVVLYNLSIGLIIWQQAGARRKERKLNKNFIKELAIDDNILKDFFAEIQKDVQVTAEPNTVDEPPTLEIQIVSRVTSKPVMDICRTSKDSVERMKEVAAKQRAAAIADQAARRQSMVPQIFKFISDIRA